MRFRAPGSGRRRSGTVLLLFVLLVFALMGIAALTIDVGYAFLAQGQMQNATDSAAVEGARLRDYNQANWYSNRSRRSRVEEMVRQSFDDDLRPYAAAAENSEYSIDYFYEPSLSLLRDTNHDQLNLGMGPRIKVEGSAAPGTSQAESNIGAVIRTGTLPYLDDPGLAPNQENKPYGDMLNGTFVPNKSPQEQSYTYIREDFTPAPLQTETGDQAVGNVGLYESLGFLVRLRRVKGDFPGSDSGETTTASFGPPLPYLFGLGTGMHRAAGSSYNPRTDGISVRATSLASSAPAFAVGYPPCDSTAIYRDGSANGTKIMGHYGVFFAKQFWTAITLGAGYPQWNTVCYYAKLEPSGTLILEGTSQCGTAPGSGGPPAPWAEQFIGQAVGSLGDRGNVIGDRLYPTSLSIFQNGADRDGDGTINDEDRAAARCRWIGLADASLGGMGSSSGDERGFFGIYMPVVHQDPQTGESETISRVIGFGFGRAMLIQADPSTGGEVRLVFGAGLPSPHLSVDCWVAQDNASPHLQLALLKDELEVIRPEEWAQVLAASQQFTYANSGNPHDYKNINRGAVLAATLVR